jgi:hypothetical protein
MSRLQEHWRAVLADFFPKWKAARLWRCTTRCRRTALGYCDPVRHTVEIRLVSEDDDALDMLLIHEIAHAVASRGHDMTWQRRIGNASAKSRKLGRTKLADLLDNEVAKHNDHPVTRARV